MVYKSFTLLGSEIFTRLHLESGGQCAGVWFIRIFPDFRIFCDQNFCNFIDFQPDFVCFSPILRYFSGFFYYFQDFSWKANHTPECGRTYPSHISRECPPPPSAKSCTIYTRWSMIYLKKAHTYYASMTRLWLSSSAGWKRTGGWMRFTNPGRVLTSLTWHGKQHYNMAFEVLFHEIWYRPIDWRVSLSQNSNIGFILSKLMYKQRFGINHIIWGKTGCFSIENGKLMSA